MTKFVTSYNSLAELYKTHLTKIKDIKFTFREIDVIACVISKKGDKKIAALCDISPRTVSSHVYNIMNKIGCNSKDQIIEFVEFSGKLLVFREYYLHLMVRSYFYKLLSKIGKVNKEIVQIYCLRGDEAQYSSLFEALKKDLAIANINLNSCSAREQTSSNIIDISKAYEEKYYFEVLEIIHQVLPIKESENPIKEFGVFFTDIDSMFDGRQISGDNVRRLFTLKTKNSKIFFATLILFFIGTIFCISKYRNEFYNHGHNQEVVEEFLALLKDNEISSNNVTLDNITKNQSLIKKIEKIVKYSDSEPVKNYLNNAEMESEILTNYMYILQALASYNMYNRHDGETSKNVLLTAKRTAENYINSRSNLELNFEELTPQEILSELRVVKHLPETYTRVIYSLARSHLYMSGEKDFDKSRKYFEISKFLGQDLGLFEGYLSEASGVLSIDFLTIKNFSKLQEKDIKNKRLNDILNRYSELKDDNKEYILDYNPRSDSQAKIIPSRNEYNRAACASYIFEIYNTLISNCDSMECLNHYADNLLSRIKNYVVPDISFLDGKVPQKKIAGLYNILGNILVTFSEKQYETEKMREVFCKILKTDSKEPLEFAEILFEKAVELSRNTDFTKADAYEGLYRILNYKIQDKKLSPEKKSMITKEMNKFKNKQETINQNLKRK